MNNLLSVVTTTVFLAGVVLTNATAAPSDAEAVEFAKKAFAGKVITCPCKTPACKSRVLTHTGHVLIELHDAGYVPHRDTVSAAERLNGIDYVGSVKLVFDAYRMFGSGEWGEWQDPASLTTLLVTPIALTAGDGVPWGYVTAFVHKNGQWVTTLSSVENVPQLSCVLAESIESPAAKAAQPGPMVEVPGKAAQLFVPNGILKHDHWTDDCTFAKGTRVMVVGHDPNMADFVDSELVIIDPDAAVCRNRHRTITATVPQDDIEAVH